MDRPETIQFRENDMLPQCPHCGGTLQSIVKYKHGGTVEHHIIACPLCSKIIGYSAVR